MRNHRWLALPACLLALSACSAGAKPAVPQAVSAVQVPGEAATATVSTRTLGRLGSVLVDADGLTLYANAQETGAKPACDGTCRRTWPLVLAAPGVLPPVSGRAAAAQLSAVSLAGVRVLSYGGHPLHRYVGDAGPGASAGQGVQQVWACVTAAGTLATGYP